MTNPRPDDAAMPAAVDVAAIPAMIQDDWDLEGCLQHNPQPDFSFEDIAAVLAVWEGENDGDDWRWVLRLKDDRFVFLRGGCDYTGWDCQSSADSRFAASAEAAAAVEVDRTFGEEWDERRDEIRDELLRQLVEGRVKTRREIVGEGLSDG